MDSERVKGSATKTNWKRRYSSQALPGPPRVIFRILSVKVVARILRRILVTLYIYNYSKISMRLQQCVRFARYARSLSIIQLRITDIYIYTVDPRLSERLGTKILSDNPNLRIIEVH